jgi:hypothetical protein
MAIKAQMSAVSFRETSRGLSMPLEVISALLLCSEGSESREMDGAGLQARKNHSEGVSKSRQTNLRTGGPKEVISQGQPSVFSFHQVWH